MEHCIGFALTRDQTLAAETSISAGASGIGITKPSILNAQKIIRKAHARINVEINVRHIVPNDIRFAAFHDAGWASRPDGFSQGGLLYCFLSPQAPRRRAGDPFGSRLEELEIEACLPVQPLGRVSGDDRCSRQSNFCLSLLRRPSRTRKTTASPRPR